jgi:hypothetical protein
MIPRGGLPVPMARLTTEALMHWRVIVGRVDPKGHVERCVIADFERRGLPRESDVGLSHEEGKLVLHALQSGVAMDQSP